MADEIIRLSLNTRQLEFFAQRLPRVLAYCSQEALNNTMKNWVQPAVFERTRATFQIRVPKFFFGTDKQKGGVAGRITAFASVKDARPFAELTGGIMSTKLPEADRHRGILFSYFETGGTRRPFTPGAKSVAEPVKGAARPSWPEKVLPQYKFSALQLRPWYKPPGSAIPGRKGKHPVKQSRLPLPAGRRATPGYYAIPGIQWKGRLGTFVKFTPKLPHGGVFQRDPSNPKAPPRLLWAFDPPFPLKAKLNWVEAAREAAVKHFNEEMEKKLDERLKHEASRAANAAAAAAVRSAAASAAP